ncbi:ABC transporter ATP-binding protein [Paenibacillus sp. GCM10023248]|nr:ABC transporter ATP-binding protein [Bacillus sp. 3255]MDD9269140.1 ABC transporter ATP-binding protein [Paenibacillus sp. MAHUQ-63]
MILTIVGLGILQFIVPMTVPWMTKVLIDEVLPLKSSSWTLSKVIGVLAAVYLFGTIVNYARQWVMARMGNSMVIDIRFQLYEHMQKLSQRFYDSRQVGSIVSRILNDVNGAQNLVGAGVINLVIDLFLVVFAGFMLFHMDWKLALLSLWLLPVYYLTFTNANVHIRYAWRSVHRQMERMSGVLVERIAGMKVVQAFNRELMELNRFKKQASAHYTYAMTAQFLSNTLGRISQTFQDFGGLLIWFAGGTMVIRGKMSVGELIAFQAYLSQMYGPIQRFSDVNVTIQNSLANVERIFEVFDIEPEIKNIDNPRPLKTCKGEIEFHDVGFDYVIERPEKQPVEAEPKDKDLVERQKPAKRFYWIPPKMRPDPPSMVTESRAALQGISFKARSGDVIALVGPSGAGKSTIINLLLRFYDPNKGSVTLDGEDMRNYDLHDLRSHMALVLQDNILFSGTVYENIAYGSPKASKEQIIAAAEAANAHEFIEEWELGYETMIGERGVRLSGGQKQRIAIARALLKSPRILILDEATSALDAESEHLVTEALGRLMEGRTTFVIAHRLATVVRADQILVIDRGRIVERGKHPVLLAQNGLYRELYEKQLKAMRPEELLGLETMGKQA